MSETKPKRGQARSAGPTYISVIDQDRIPPPNVLRTTQYDWVDADHIDIKRYTSQAFHDLEAERLWPATLLRLRLF